MNITEVKELIKSTPTDIAIFLWGRPGIGKSQCVKQLATEAKVGFKDVRLTTLDPTDLRGLPVINRDLHVVDWYSSSLLPQVGRDPENGYLMLDELNAAHPTIQAGAYQLVLDRAIGEYNLPPGWRIIAAGNREEDRGITFNMPRPLENRFIHIDVEVDTETWLQWAMENNISPMLIGFIMHNPGLLCPNDKDYSKHAFPTPRTWEYVSKIIQHNEGNSEKITSAAIISAVGEAAGTQFITFNRLKHELPDISKILGEGQELPLPNRPDAQYAFYGSLCGHLDHMAAHFKGGEISLAKNTKFMNGIAHIIKNMPREFGELITKYIATRHSVLFLHLVRNSSKFTEEFGNIYKEFMAIAVKYNGTI